MRLRPAQFRASLATPRAAFTTLQIPHLDSRSRNSKTSPICSLRPPSAGTMLKVDQFWQHDPIDGPAISQRQKRTSAIPDKNLYVVFLRLRQRPRRASATTWCAASRSTEEDQVGIFLDTFPRPSPLRLLLHQPFGRSAGRNILRRTAGHSTSPWDTIWKSEARPLKARLDRLHLGALQVAAASSPLTDRTGVRRFASGTRHPAQQHASTRFFPALLDERARTCSRRKERSDRTREDILPGRSFPVDPLRALADPYPQHRPARPTESHVRSQGPSTPRQDSTRKAVIKDSFVLGRHHQSTISWQVEVRRTANHGQSAIRGAVSREAPVLSGELWPTSPTPINLVFTRRIADPAVRRPPHGQEGSVVGGHAARRRSITGRERWDPTIPSYGDVRRISESFASQPRDRQERKQHRGFIYTDRELDTVPEHGLHGMIPASDADQPGRRHRWHTFRFNKNWQLDAQAVIQPDPASTTARTRPRSRIFISIWSAARAISKSTPTVQETTLPGFRTQNGLLPAPGYSLVQQLRASAAFMSEGSTCSGMAPAFTRAISGITTGLAYRILCQRELQMGFQQTATNLGIYANYGHERLRPA